LCLAAIGAAEDQSVIRVNTQLVEIDVVVHSKSGPVADLKKDDFTVFDNGKQQAISVFSVQTPVGRSAVNKSPLAPGEVSNRLTRNGQEPPSPTVVLWDALNTELEDQAWVRNQVIQYLRTMQPGDPVAVYILVKTLRVVRDFTDDPLRLIEALKHTNAEQSTDLSAPEMASLATAINPLVTPLNTMSPTQQMQAHDTLQALQNMTANAAGEMTDYALRDRVYVTQAALEAIAGHLSGLPGRKKLAWISGSFPGIESNQRSRVGGVQSEILDFSPQINHAIRALNGANVAVYPIDPRGVITGSVSASTPPSTANPAAANASNVLNSVSSGGLTASGIETMNLLASGTGGQAFYATNDVVGAIHTVMTDDAVIYRLGFYPSDAKLDGSYHSLSVKVARKGAAGADVRARKGYFSMDAKNSANGHWREELNESMQNPLEATALGLRASATPVAQALGVYDLEVALELGNLHLEREKDRWVATIAFGTLFSPSQSTTGTLETIRISLTEERLKEALKNGYTFRRKVAAGSVTGHLRVVIEDAVTGRVGSVSVPIGNL